MQKKLGGRFWAAMLIFGLMGQIAWVVENMYFNVFLYKMFRCTAGHISLMVGASAVAAAATTLFMGALSDRVGRRKLFICFGYLAWGVSILAFALIRVDVLTPLAGSAAGAMALGVALTIVMDCVMTFFGSTANDAAYNAWLTDRGDDSDRGRIEGFNSMMPLVAILVVFGGFMGFDLDRADSWSAIYLIIGGGVILIGLLGFLLIDEAPDVKPDPAPYWATLAYSFWPSTLRANPVLYAILACFAIFGISIQIFMPYLIIYYEQSLGMSNYVLVMAPAIVLASVFTALYGRRYDKKGFRAAIVPSMALLMAGYLVLIFCRSMVPVFLGSLLMMSGYLAGMAVFGAAIRDHIPAGMAGRFQGVRIIAQVLIPGVIGPAIGAFLLRGADTVVNSDGTTSFLPSAAIWKGAFAVALILCFALRRLLWIVRRQPKAPAEVTQCGDVDAAPWTVHPRPQFRRDAWQSLDGRWLLNDRPIRVPYPPQAPLSGYCGPIGDMLLYRKEFTLDPALRGGRVLLHFGAVDQIAQVSLNGISLGEHKGGYLPFEFDVTDALTDGVNVLTLSVLDALDHTYPYGKQCAEPHGMWYTPVSGIWQTVWLEKVPQSYIRSLTLTPDLTGVTVTVEGAAGFTAEVEGKVWTFPGGTGRIEPEQPRLWTPDDPYLYPITITAGADVVHSYFALRTIAIEDRAGTARVCLNGAPIFLHGVLDQGYFPDGIFLPNHPEDYDRDILAMKVLGFNLLRKHIKVEPEQFYYACDRLGMLVMQDMVNSGDYSFGRDTVLPTLGLKRLRDDRGRLDARKEFFLRHMDNTVRHLYNHPSIAAWTIFNEGWGQFRADGAYARLKRLDPTRPIDATSGWFAQRRSDFDSEHIYFRLKKLHPRQRPLLVSECGGYTLPVPSHVAEGKKYGYGGCKDGSELTARMAALYEKMILPAVPGGCCGCIYTQLSDVEGEINGLLTYDRQAVKPEAEPLLALAKQLQEAVK